LSQNQFALSSAGVVPYLGRVQLF